MKFVDTNVLVYSVDPADPAKNRRAQETMRKLSVGRDGVVSVQVLIEFANVVVRKLGHSPGKAARAVSDFARSFTVFEPKAAHVVRALEIQALCRISIWDALIVAAAEASGCDTILSEDLAAGETYCGVHVENPFP